MKIPARQRIQARAEERKAEKQRKLRYDELYFACQPKGLVEVAGYF